MTAYFERFRKLKDRHGEDPKFKGAAAAIRQARIGSSVVLGAMTIVLGTLLADIFSGPFAHLDGEQYGNSRNMVMKDVAPPPAAGEVKIISAQPKLDVSCEQQTWPYIDRRCLTESTKAPTRTAAATDGVASPEGKAAQSQTVQSVQIVGPAASMDSASEAQPSSPSATGSASVQTAAIVPLPVARPAIASTIPATAADQPAAGAATEDRQEAREEKPRRRASRRHRDRGERVVRRGRELIYDLPDGRVLIFPRGMF